MSGCSSVWKGRPYDPLHNTGQLLLVNLRDFCSKSSWSTQTLRPCQRKSAEDLAYTNGSCSTLVVEASQQDTSLADKIDSVSTEEAAISAECPAPGLYQSCSWQQIYMCSLSLGTDESAVDIC